MEIRLAPWGNLDDDALIVGRARAKRAAARTRVVALPSATSLELKRWRLESGRPSDDEPIVGPMTKSALVQWGWKKLQPTAKRLLGRDDVTLYTLRHTHASACHCAGFTVPAAARRLGHSPVLHVKTYAHVIDALEGKPRHADLDALIGGARAELSELGARARPVRRAFADDVEKR